MNTNREMLRLAAKAAGFTIVLWERGGHCHPNIVNPNEPISLLVWNPIVFNKDAFQLMVALRMSVTVFDDAIGIGIEDCGYQEYKYAIDLDHAAATRMAITEAAALRVGKNML